MRALLLITLLVAVAASACANAVDAGMPPPEDAAVPGHDAALAPTVCRHSMTASSITEDEARYLLGRLRHELRHLVSETTERAVASAAAGGERPITAAWSEDHGDMRAEGTLATSGGRTRAALQVRFRHWTGRHGGWGYSALEGTVQVALELSAGSQTVTACGPVQLVGGGALRGTPLAAVSYTESLAGTAPRLDGWVGPHDVARLAGR